MLDFTKLYVLLAQKHMKKTDLLEIMSSTTLAAIGKKNIETKTIEKICDFLTVQPGDIMEYVKE